VRLKKIIFCERSLKVELEIEYIYSEMQTFYWYG